MESLFLTIEQSKHLQELGLDMSDAKFCHKHYSDMYEDYWCIVEYSDFAKGNFFNMNVTIIPTYTLQEILDKLPKKIEVGKNYSRYSLVVNYDREYVAYRGNGSLNLEYFKEDKLNAAYNMLCWALENGFLNNRNGDKKDNE